MARRPDSFAAIVATFALAVVGVAIAGVLAAPDPLMTDPRRSTRLTGPNGASGLAEALAALGVTVKDWELPLFRLDTVAASDGEQWLAILEPTVGFAEAEVPAIGRWLARGNHVFAAGSTDIERCFGLRILPLVTTTPRPDRALRTADSLNLHSVRNVLRPARPSTLNRRPADCDHVPRAVDRSVVLTTVAGDTVAMRLTLDSGASVLLLADSHFLSNEDLKETDAALVMLPLLLPFPLPLSLSLPLSLPLPSFLFDNFHHAFGSQGSLPAATMAWMLRTPLGWAMLQLAFVGLLLVGARAVRFGPAIEVVHRERRSPLDHVDALATGLARSRQDNTVIVLLVDGLRRRLGRSGSVDRATPERLAVWLDTLKLATRTDAARDAVERLKTALNRPGDASHVLTAARTVEELWLALQPKTISAQS